MLTSFLVFSSILIFSLLFCKIPVLTNSLACDSKTNLINQAFKEWFPIICISLIIGFRYNVGKDWLSYTLSYDRLPIGSLKIALEDPDNSDWLYTILVYILKSLHLPSCSIFIVSTFIILLLYYKSFSNFPQLLPYGLFTLFTLNTFYLFLNIMRQGISFFIILYAIKYLIYKKPLKYTIFVLLAAGFHKTSLILLPFLFLSYWRHLIFKRVICCAIYLLTWFYGSILFSYFLTGSSYFLTDKFAHYSYSIEFLNMEEGSGLGLLLLHILDLILIFLSPYCYKLFKSKGYDIYFNLFFIGVIIQNIAGMNMLLARIPFCLVSMRLIVAAFTLHLCLNTKYYHHYLRKKVKMFGYLSILIISIAIISFIGNCIQFDYSFKF